MTQAWHYLEKKIYYHDTDCGGVVYYANYLKHMEEGRTEYCLDRGISVKDLAGEGIYFVVANIQINYKGPARYQDTVRVATCVERVGRSSIGFVQQILREDALLVESRTTWVCVGADFKPRSIPENVRGILAQGLKETQD